MNMCVDRNLGNNGISGTLASGWSSLVAMKYLMLGKNLLSGTIVEGLLSLTLLQSLGLQQNSLSGTITEGLSSLTALQVLRLDQNSLSGTTSSRLCDLTSTQCNVSANAFVCPIPSCLSSMCVVSIILKSPSQLRVVFRSLVALTANSSISSRQLSGSLMKAPHKDSNYEPV